MSFKTTTVYVGVDVSKERLDVFVRWGEAREEGEHFEVPNNEAGIDELLARLEEAGLPRWWFWRLPVTSNVP